MKYLNQTIFRQPELGYVSITLLDVPELDSDFQFDSFADMLFNSDFFEWSEAFMAENVPPGKDKLPWKNYGYFGRYLISSMKDAGYRKYDWKDFRDILRNSMIDQRDHGPLYGLPPDSIEMIQQSVLSVIEQFASAVSFFLELFPGDAKEWKGKFYGSMRWDYFKCFIGMDLNNKRLYRIEMGVD